MRKYNFFWPKSGLDFLLFLIFSLNSNLIFAAQEAKPTEKIIIFLVHGTFGKDSSWYQEKGSFFKAIKEWAIQTCNCDVEIKPFAWSGSLLASERLAAALNFSKKLIYEKSVSEHEITKFIVIGHSHGANIAFLATQLIYIASLKSNNEIERGILKLVTECLTNETDKQLFKTCNMLFLNQLIQKVFVNILTHEVNQLFGQEIRSEFEKTVSIEEIYALGAPIDIKRYFPEQNIVKKVYSFYSLGDKIQVYSNPFKRRFSEFDLLKNNSKEFITEIKITLAKNQNSKGSENPCHTQLYNPCIGRWICNTPQIIQENRSKEIFVQNYSQFTMQFYSDLSRPIIK